MSGHSKWSTIKRKKGALDAKRGKIFSKLAREIAVAAKLGGGDPSANTRLRNTLIAARANNMPKDSVERAIKKGTGELPGVMYEEVRYECYATAGVALLIDVLTDNKSRTVAELRHLITRHGGAMAESGAVKWNFEPRGVITVAKGACSEEEFFEKAIEVGAEDVDTSGDLFEVTTNPQELHTVAEGLEKQGLKPESVQLTMMPKSTVKVTGREAESVLKLLELLEDLDDVQNVYANFDISEEEMAAVVGG